MLAALDADDDVRVPHEVALDIMRGEESHPGISKSPGHHAEGTVQANRYCRRVLLRG